MTLSVDDRAALRALVHRYAANVDDRQFRSVVRRFTATAELLVPDPPAALEPIHSHRGQEAIAEAIAAVAAVTRTEHAIIGEVYDGTARPGTARGRIPCTPPHGSQQGEELVEVVGPLPYDDNSELTDAGWPI